MSNERIDLTQWKNEHREVYACCEAGEHYTDVLLAELKRCYELIDQAKANLTELFEVLLSGEAQDMVNYLEGSHTEQDYAQGSGEVESTLGDGVPEWNAGPNM